jgi:hypothetical protein
MSRNAGFTTRDIMAIFADEIAAAGGSVSDTFDDGERLFTRSVLPEAREVRPRDRVQGGVALKATAEEAWVHPYVFRLVCKNGAIRAHAVETRHITEIRYLDPQAAGAAVREAVRACCSPQAFTAGVAEIRSANQTEADVAIGLLAFMGSHGQQMRGPVLRRVMDQFFQEGDRSRFGLMNAVTAVARDTEDPETRWRLEGLGGGIPAGLSPKPVRDDRTAEILPLPERELSMART